ncbi:hypothetical protein FA13DRAFT_1843167, partial [Coprinellus micaceus]
GLIPSSPYTPNYAVSIRTMEVYCSTHLRCPHLAIEPFVKSICDISGVPYRSTLRKNFSACYDVYLKLRDESEKKILQALGRVGLWRRKNVCLACTYELNGEEKLQFKILVTMDGNDSLKQVLRRCLDPSYQFDDGDGDEDSTPPASSSQGTQLEDPRNVGEELYLPASTVNRYTKLDDKDLRTSLEDDGNPCAERWKNMSTEKTEKMWGMYDETGIFLCLCRHGFAVAVADMVKSGELSKYPLAIVEALLDAFGEDIGAGYDIGCRFSTPLRNSPLGHRAEDSRFHCLVGSFHGHAHNRLCQLLHLATYVLGLGLEDLEGCERFFAKSNTLASCIRYASTFHRRQKIEQYIKHVDKLETPHQLGKFLVDNYKQALGLIAQESALREQIARRGISNPKDVFHAWLKEEHDYLTGLSKEPLEETLQMEYYQRLINLKARKYVNETSTFIQYDPSQPKSRNGSKAVIARRIAQENYDKAVGLVHESEHLLGVEQTWSPTSQPFLEAAEMVRRRRYQRCLDELERLVVQRIFELTRMNLSKTGYKLRKHIAQALSTRSQAIRAALERYNAAARAFKPPRRVLTWDQVVNYAFLSDFDLLRDTRCDIRDRLWAQPINRALMDEWFKIERAHEEIKRLNIEIRRVVTHIRDEKGFLIAAEKAAGTSDPTLAFHIRLYREERTRFSSVHLQRFSELAKTPGFSGSIKPGVSIDPTLRGEGCQAMPSDEYSMEVDEPDPSTLASKDFDDVEDEGGEEEEEDLDARLHVLQL